MNRVCLIGAGGRMGKAIIEVLSHSNTSTISAAIEKEDSLFLGLDSGLSSGIKETKVPLTSDIQAGIKNSDTVIDFSHHSNIKKILSDCTNISRPLVIGATGHSESEKKEIELASKKIPIVFSPNMSVGVNLLFKLLEIAAGVLKDDFDIEILDIHHRHKKDAPSGTAQGLKSILLKALARTEDQVIYGREGNHYTERDSKQIAIHTMRAGEVIGEHTVFFFSPEERIEITHKANDRKTFAVGAVRASEFVQNRKPGLYSMFDVLGL
ncbi:MAG: 4-hydroxy-tetrahydrodipicolinate reductase [Leptospiraceae bacterium]|nr:4-hydroxy-tetrahydrodipicolinate reductase [Leptospiraceae bacterium]